MTPSATTEAPAVGEANRVAPARVIRVLFIDEVAEIAGGGHSLNYLMRYLPRPRFEPLLLSPPGPIADLAARAGIPVLAYSFRQRYQSFTIGGREIPLNPRRLAYRLADAWHVRRLVARERVDLVHTNNLDAHLVGWFLNRLFGIPVVWHIRTNWPRAFYRIPWPTRIVFVSDAVRRRALGAHAADPRARVVYNGIRPDEFDPGRDTGDEVRGELSLPRRPIVGTVGRLTPWKRQDLFLEAARQLTSAGVDATWMIVGAEIENRSGTAHTQHLRDLASRLGVADRVVFTGLRRDVGRLVRAFDVFVSPADDDPNPRTVLEAMVCGRPIVASTSGGVPEMLDGGAAGLLTPKGDAHALATGVRRLLDDRALAARLGAAAATRARSLYTIEHHVHEIERIYDEVLG